MILPWPCHQFLPFRNTASSQTRMSVIQQALWTQKNLSNKQGLEIPENKMCCGETNEALDNLRYRVTEERNYVVSAWVSFASSPDPHEWNYLCVAGGAIHSGKVGSYKCVCFPSVKSIFFILQSIRIWASDSPCPSPQDSPLRCWWDCLTTWRWADSLLPKGAKDCQCTHFAFNNPKGWCMLSGITRKFSIISSPPPLFP